MKEDTDEQLPTVRLNIDEDRNHHSKRKSDDSHHKSRSVSKQHSFLRRPEFRLNQSGFQRLLPRCLRFVFADKEAESLYRDYSRNEKTSDLRSLLLILIVVDVFLAVIHILTNLQNSIPQLSVFGVLFIAATILLVVCWWKRQVPKRIWTFIPPAALVVEAAHMVCDMPLRLPSEALIWLLLYTYCIYVLLPLPLAGSMTLGFLLALLHFLLVGIVPLHPSPYFGYQIGANVLLVLCVNMLGTMTYFFCERQQRKAFLETRHSLEAKIVLEEESLKQERLLLSVLPRHVAAEIREDLGEVVTGQFKKIYMSRHENVSILFADIVGFTAFSSTCPAPELVKTLNELFARFDTLAEKYHQLRIKILGDCYYCISGAPEERSDHAVLCVHMGLSMVDAIRSVREQTKSTVDMRVGIHTGAILAGVLGQKQWQFDVYSRDVELANKMESGGLPGRVHISEETMKFLDGEFEVSPGDGASREEAIRLAGINTYLIERVIKPYPDGTLDSMKPVQNGSGTSKEESNDVSVLMDQKHRDSGRLHEEIVSKESDRKLGNNVRMISLWFKDPEVEAKYRASTDVTTSVSLSGLPLTFFCSGIAYLLVFTSLLHTYLILAIGLLVLTAIFATGSGAFIPELAPRVLLSLSRLMQKRVRLRLVALFIMVVIWLSFLTTAAITCNSEFFLCPLPQYLVYLCEAALLGLTLLTHVSHLLKSTITLFIVIVQCCFNFALLDQSFSALDARILLNKSNVYDNTLGYSVTTSISLVGVLAALVIINRQFEKTSRRMFLWQEEVEKQKEQVADMRRKNEALVCNILPPHVASHFLGRQRDDEELYSKSYEAVGVLFAAMPNFSDFYTEETVNNQGLECLRFLNEVISDYDALLEQPRFRDIFKIKTIGATYMAASGLNSEEVGAEAPIQEKWSHLATLTDFAIALKDTLSNINKESFNNFVLRIGINQGPITAGVIGARKPHYDMWGNTVNVASRMESTGKAGHIQVVEETAHILEVFGFVFEQRGLVSVKGKGKLMTYYLTGKIENGKLQITAMKTPEHDH